MFNRDELIAFCPAGHLQSIIIPEEEPSEVHAELITQIAVTWPLSSDIGTIMPLLTGPIPTAVWDCEDHILLLGLLASKDESSFKDCNSCMVGNLQPTDPRLMLSSRQRALACDHVKIFPPAGMVDKTA